MSTNMDMIYFAIPEDGKGPSFGPVLNRTDAERAADAMPGYVIGIDVSYVGWSAIEHPEAE